MPKGVNKKVCPHCKGTGQIGDWDDVTLGVDGPPEKCATCNGSGFVRDTEGSRRSGATKRNRI